jgi:protein-S-isoprenylcysteine O-methyltransferase Ste14
MLALTLATVGIYAAVSTFWSVPTAILTGTGAAAGLALANSIGNLGGLAGPSIVGLIKQATDSFTAALLFLAGAMALGGVIALLFGRTARAGASPSPAIPRAGEQLRFSGIRRRGREFVYALLRFWRLACPRRRLIPTEARP